VTPGTLEICKVNAAGSPSGQSVAFDVDGVVVPVVAGQCVRLPFRVGKRVRVTETTVPVGTVLIGITLTPAGAGTTELATRSAIVDVGIDVATLTFTNGPTGVLSICKGAGPGIPLGTSFSFTVARQTVVVPAGPVTGALSCTEVTVPAGDVTVTEVATPDATVTDINSAFGVQILSRDLPARSAVVRLTPGQTIGYVMFVNQSTYGTFSICKGAGPGVPLGTNFTFTAAGQTVTVPAGPVSGALSCGSLRVLAGDVTVTETPLAGYAVSGFDGGFGVQQLSTDPAAGKAVVRVLPGQTLGYIMFINQLVP
jgi:hypothetical protein